MIRVARSMRSLVAVLEVRVLAIWIALATSVWLFLQLASEVSEGDLDTLDRKLLFLFRIPGQPGQPVGSLWLQEAMRDITALGGFTLLALISTAAVIGLLLYNKRRIAAVLAVAVIGAQLSSEFLKSFYDRARPDLVLHAVRVYSQSFPSGHSTTAAATYFTLAAIVATLETSRRGKILAFSLAAAITIAVGISRIYLGVHWPSDVLAGWIVGGGWALAAWLALSGFRLTHPRDADNLPSLHH